MRARKWRIAVLVNPRAGTPRRDPGLADRLAAILVGRGEVHATSPATLPGLADTLCRGLHLVALCGGDGTGTATLTELARAAQAAAVPLPPIALLGGGTMNTVARNLGISGSPEALLRRLVIAAESAALPTVAQPLLTVNGRRGFLFAAALGARFLELYYEAETPTPARAARLAAYAAASAALGGALARRLFRPAEVQIVADGEPARSLAARMLVASTVVDVGVGMRICPRATAAPDRFQLVASGLPPSAMARQLPAVLAGQPLVGAPALHLDRLARRAELRFAADEPYTLDGDLFRARVVTLELAERISVVRA
jgi:diacylglycerol kinase family enzyme